jgi:hypothetical protein
MSGECEICGEHALECECLYLTIIPPEGKEFRKCLLCENPYIYDGTSLNCLWCEINKEESVKSFKESID